jgi:hypothetical protein
MQNFRHGAAGVKRWFSAQRWSITNKAADGIGGPLALVCVGFLGLPADTIRGFMKEIKKPQEYKLPGLFFTR